MEMFSMIKHSLVSDGINPIVKHFTIVKQVASAGPEMVWKIYEARRIKDDKEASVFLFEKKIADKLHKPKRREMVTEMLRTEVKMMSRLKHPRILRVMHPLEECHDSLAFATEPVFASLANVLGNCDRLLPVPQEIKDYSFLEVEIKCGIMQITEALAFLHADESMLHGNVSPQSVVINKKGTWKLTGFGFSQIAANGKEVYQRTAWTPKLPKMVQPDLDYLAPEIQLEIAQDVTVFSDMFSLGLVICAIHNNGHSLIQANHNISTYARHSEQLTELFSEVAHKMPLQFVEPVEKMINKDIRYRPTARYFSMLRYFKDPVARCMQGIDNIERIDLSQKCEFFSNLSQAIPKFPAKVLYSWVFPVLIDQMDNADVLPLILPSLIAIIETATADQYCKTIWPEFKRVFTMTRPVQATVYLLQKLDVILDKASEEEIHKDILPMVFSTLESNSIQGQEAAIGVFITLKKYIDDQTLRKLVLPKAKALFMKSENVRTRLNALACIDRLIDSLDKMMILDEVLPFLTEISCQDVDIIMSVISIYKHMLSDKRFGLTHNLLATKVMPTLIPLTVSPGLKLEQFSMLMEVLREMLEQIYRQRHNKMLGEVPDTKALEIRSGLQQMYYLAQRTSTIKLPEEYLMMARMGKRSSFGSNSSIGSNYSFGRQSPRRTSIDMRYNVFDPPKIDSILGNQYLVPTEESYGHRHRRGACNRYGNRQAPSTPELQTNSLSEPVDPKAYRRHSSFQGLGCEEQAVLDKIVKARKASLAPGMHSLPAGNNPHILVSGASISDFDHSFFYTENPRRCSTQSVGPVVVPEPGRRDSKGRLLDAMLPPERRSSFQGICDVAMQFFVGK